jgi:hypothetical protein
LPKSWHKQQLPQESPDDRPGPKKPKVRMYLQWDEGDPQTVKLPWVFDDVDAANQAIEEWREAVAVDDPPAH